MRPRVTLIGAGPGDPELLTLRAVRALGAADVVLVDALVHRDCLNHARPGAQIIEVGKRAGCRSTSQAFMEAGLSPATPACIIENGTLEAQKQVVTTLGRLCGAGFRGPAIIVVGAVVGFARSLRQEKARAA